MAGNLFDQLKKAGLIDEKKAQKAKKAKYQQTKQKKGKKGELELNEAAKLAAKVAQEKAERDRQLNLERKQAQEKKAAQAELCQLIESNRLSNYDGNVVYNFADDHKVKTFNVTQKIYKQLVAGTVRVARFESGYVLISDLVAEKVELRDKTVLIPIAGEDESISKEDQDYYAQFEVPDDLIW